MGDVTDKLQEFAMKSLAPIFINIELTRRCNLNCDHCYVDHHIKDQLSVEQLDHIFADIARTGGLFLGFTGGEVGLRKDLHEIIAAAREYRFSVKILSTGTLFTDTDIARLAQAGVRQVKVSIYSSRPEMHDAVVRVKGSLAKSLRAIRRLREVNVEVVMACPVMRGNATELASIVALGKEYDCRVELDSRINPLEDGSTEPCALQLTAGELAVAYDYPDVAQTMFRGRDADGAFSPREPDAAVCNAGRSLAFIDSRGDLFPCVWWRQKVGNVLTDGFENLWRHSPVFDGIRQITNKDLHECQDCKNQKYCSVCPGATYQEKGDPTLAGTVNCNDAESTRIYFEQLRHQKNFVDPGIVNFGQSHRPSAGAKKSLPIIRS